MLIFKNGTLEIHGEKSVLFGPHFTNCSHGATITFTQPAVYLNTLDAKMYSLCSGSQPGVISLPKGYLTTSGPIFGCHNYRKAIHG